MSLLSNANSNQPIRLTIIGDSLTEWSDGFGLAGILGPRYVVRTLGRAGWDTELWINNLAEPKSIPTDIYLIALGTNDASYRGTQGFNSRFEKLLLELNQRGLFKMVVSTTPLTNQIGMRPAIQANNLFLRGLSTRQNTWVVDVESTLNTVDPSPFYPLNDPIHPISEGYELLGRAYQTKILALPL